MRLQSKFAAAVGLAATLLAAPAVAGPLPNGGVTRQEIVDWLHSKGYPGEIETTSTGSVVVSSKTADIGFDIYFYDCTGQRCRGIQYAAGWSGASSVTLDAINRYNKDNRYLRVYMGSGANVWAEYDVDVAPGGTYELLDESLRTYSSVIVSFRDEMGF